MQHRFGSHRSILLASILALACTSPTGGTTDAGSGGGTDTGNGGTDSGNGGTDSGSGTVDSGNGDVDSGSSDVDSGVSDVDANVTTDAGSAGGCLFQGRYLATNIRCNGTAYSQAAALTPPAGSWIATDDGTHATFTETIGTCSLIATGHIDCDTPAVGQFTHHPDAPLSCNPAACVPFATACSGGAVGADATWSYTRNADGSIEASTSATSIRTCTAAGQQNPVQITWVPMP